MTRGSVIGILPITGELRTETIVRVGSLLPGQVTHVLVAVGDRVRRGQEMARLDDVEQRATLRSAGAQLAYVELQGVKAQKRFLESMLSLHGTEALPDDLSSGEIIEGPTGDAQLLVMQALVQIDSQRHAVAHARELVSRRVIRAPGPGIVLDRSIDPGDTVNPGPLGAPLFVIGSEPRRLHLDLAVSELYVARIQPGAVRLTVPAYPGRTFMGEVRRIADTAIAGSRPVRYRVTIEVENANGVLKPGMSALAMLPMVSSETSLRVPMTALDGIEQQGEGNGGVLWTFDRTNRPVRVTAELGVSNGEMAEVHASGIGPGTRVIVSDDRTSAVPPPFPRCTVGSGENRERQ